MLISQKCQYAIRAIFDLARHYEQGPMRIADIAEAQAIPARFLEVILSQLKQAGFVASQRGNVGGYYLVREPRELTVGDVIRFVQGPLTPVGCVPGGNSKEKCALHNDCVFMPLWNRVEKAMADVYDSTSFRDLVEQDKTMRQQYISTYSI